MSKYWLSPLNEFDDFGDRYESIMFDGKTQMGPWANMTLRSWLKYGAGLGQQYDKQPDGKWMQHTA